MSKKDLWFRAKRYGWGWYPTNWKGWLSIFVYALGVVYFVSIGTYTAKVTDDLVVNVILPVTLTSMLLAMFCFEKGETPKWQWGKRGVVLQRSGEGKKRR